MISMQSGSNARVSYGLRDHAVVSISTGLFGVSGIQILGDYGKQCRHRYGSVLIVDPLGCQLL